MKRESYEYSYSVRSGSDVLQFMSCEAVAPLVSEGSEVGLLIYYRVSGSLRRVLVTPCDMNSEKCCFNFEFELLTGSLAVVLDVVVASVLLLGSDKSSARIRTYLFAGQVSYGEKNLSWKI